MHIIKAPILQWATLFEQNGSSMFGPPCNCGACNRTNFTASWQSGGTYFQGSLDASNPGRTLRSLLGTIAWQILKLRNLKGKLLLGCQFFIMHNAMVAVRWQSNG